jgi:hypothetical protein
MVYRIGHRNMQHGHRDFLKHTERLANADRLDL